VVNQGHVVPAIPYARVEIMTHGGGTFSAERDSPEAMPLDWGAWLRRDGERVVGRQQLDRLQTLMTHLEDVADVTEVMACTRPTTDRA